MQVSIHTLKRRDGGAYRGWKHRILRERPVCEHCHKAASAVVSHIRQPLFFGGLMDPENVFALCRPCDRAFTRSNPPLRRKGIGKAT